MTSQLFSQIYLHEEGVEYWIQLFLFPGSSPSFTEIDTRKGISYQIGILKYKIHQNVNSKQYQCDPNASMESFTKCAFSPFKNLGCTPIFTKLGMNFNESNICTNYSAFKEMEAKILDHLRSTLRYNGLNRECMEPCSKVSYDASFREMHKNARILYEPKNSSVSFVLKYDNLMVETKEEYFLMSIGSLISNIGGFLGLFLGFSCLSLTLWTNEQAKGCMK